MTLRTWLTAIRPKTLTASISPILVAGALAYRDGAFQPFLFLLILLCALSLQISVNLANDLFDGRSGVDQPDRLGPKRVLNEGLVSARELGYMLWGVSILAALLGLWIVVLSDWVLLLFGLLSLLAVFAYSGGPLPLASNALGEVTVFLFFGVLAVAGAYFALADRVSSEAIIFGCGVGTVSAAIMLVNNVRDIPTDLRAGKRTLAALLGVRASVYLYIALLLLGVVCATTALMSSADKWLLLCIVAVLLWRAVILGQAMQRASGREYNTMLAKTAAFLFIYSVCFSFIIVLGTLA